MKWCRVYVQWLISQSIIVGQLSLLKSLKQNVSFKDFTTGNTTYTHMHICLKVWDSFFKINYHKLTGLQFFFSSVTYCLTSQNKHTEKIKQTKREYLFQVNLEWPCKIFQHHWRQSLHFLFHFLKNRAARAD